MGMHTKMGSEACRCVFHNKGLQVIGEKLPRVYFLQFLANPGAGRARLGVFEHSGAIGTIYLESKH
jgi:hypothetical protein